MNRTGSERGQATVEFTLLLPVFVLALLAVVQVALLVRDQIAVVHAAREAVREASVDPDPNAALRVARSTLAGVEVFVGPRPAVGESISVEVTYVAKTDLPLVGVLMPDPTLRARAVMRVER